MDDLSIKLNEWEVRQGKTLQKPATFVFAVIASPLSINLVAENSTVKHHAFAFTLKICRQYIPNHLQRLQNLFTPGLGTVHLQSDHSGCMLMSSANEATKYF